MRIALALIAGPAFTTLAAAQECPPPAEVSGELEALFERARTAEDFRQGQAVSDAMWQVWLRAPDEAAQAVLDRGMSARDSYDFAGAHREFTRLIDYCP